MLATYAVINVVLTAVCMGGGTLGMYAMFGTFFFMSVMFPTIFALGIRGLGDYTKLGSSLIVMSIVGGAIARALHGQNCGHPFDAHRLRGAVDMFCVCSPLRLVWPDSAGKIPYWLGELSVSTVTQDGDGNFWMKGRNAMSPSFIADALHSQILYYAVTVLFALSPACTRNAAAPDPHRRSGGD